MIAEEALWYVQKGSRVQGPFTADEVGRFLLLGRVRNTDRVSRDGELWEPVTQVPELIPEALLDLGSEQGWATFLAARTRGDERAQPPPEMPPPHERRDAGTDGAERTRADWRYMRLRHSVASGPHHADARPAADPASGQAPTSGDAARGGRRGGPFGGAMGGPAGGALGGPRGAPSGSTVATALAYARRPAVLLPWSLLGITLTALGVVLWLNASAPG